MSFHTNAEATKLPFTCELDRKLFYFYVRVFSSALLYQKSHCDELFLLGYHHKTCGPEDLPEAMDNREAWQERVRDICANSVT